MNKIVKFTKAWTSIIDQTTTAEFINCLEDGKIETAVNVIVGRDGNNRNINQALLWVLREMHLCMLGHTAELHVSFKEDITRVTLTVSDDDGCIYGIDITDGNPILSTIQVESPTKHYSRIEKSMRQVCRFSGRRAQDVPGRGFTIPWSGDVKLTVIPMEAGNG